VSVLAEDRKSSDGHGILKTLQDFTFCLSISNSAIRITDYLIEITYFHPNIMSCIPLIILFSNPIPHS
jgi:hypothetical protein